MAERPEVAAVFGRGIEELQRDMRPAVPGGGVAAEERRRVLERRPVPPNATKLVSVAVRFRERTTVRCRGDPSSDSWQVRHFRDGDDGLVYGPAGLLSRSSRSSVLLGQRP